jgi:hypothetical protein
MSEVRDYFASLAFAEHLARDFNIGGGVDTLTNSSFKLLLEPIAYFTFQSERWGMTAHEAAMLNEHQLARGDVTLRSKMTSLTHQNLPLAMFLERPDLGFPAYTGTLSGTKDDLTIRTYLGIGTVTYTEKQEEPAPTPSPPPGETPPPSSFDMDYRVDTDVITSVMLHATDEINPDRPATVTFNIVGQNFSRTHTMSNIVIPEGASQLVWAKWRTPQRAQNVTITVSTNRGYLGTDRINARIVDLSQNEPPDPLADDRNDNFRLRPMPNNAQRTSARWTVWWAQWHEYWVWIPNWVWISNWVTRSYRETYTRADGTTGSYRVTYEVDRGWWEDHGWWEDQGWWDFFTDIYTASLTAASSIMPDEMTPTARGKTMGSGYGVNNEVSASVSSNAPISHRTEAQTAVSWFPEFEYRTYWRLLEFHTDYITGRRRLVFKENEFDPWERRAHFTPIWYPCGPYDVYTWLLDAWTPDGMLSRNLSDGITIQGSLWDDRRVAPLPVN